MWDRLSKFGIALALPLFALGFFLGAYFFFYRGGYDPPPRVDIPFESLVAPVSSLTTFTEVAPLHEGTLLVDATHGNNFIKGEVTSLLTRVADRGHEIQFIGESSFFGGFRSLSESERFPLLEEKLRQADSLAVILPNDPFSKREIDLVERFVQKGGRLLLIADPTRNHQINSLAERFGMNFQPDYLYNTVEYDLNYQNIFIRNFRADAVTQGLEQIALYTAGSVKFSGPGLAHTDANTHSSLVERIEPFYPVVRGAEGRVLAIADLTFMVPPRNSILDNDRLISNIADFLTTSDRGFDLADFPYFFGDQVDILMGRSSLFELGAEAKDLLSEFQIDSQIQGVENIGKDTFYIGLYEDASDVAQYLDIAGIQIGDVLRTPFTPDFDRSDTAVMLLHASPSRHVLVILGDSQFSLQDMLTQLATGQFRSGLVGDFVGVYRTP